MKEKLKLALIEWQELDEEDVENFINSTNKKKFIEVPSNLYNVFYTTFHSYCYIIENKNISKCLISF